MIHEEQGIQLKEAINGYDFGEVTNAVRYGEGHINDTYLVETMGLRYILQRINTSIFKNPVKLMENIVNVTEHLRKKIVENGGDPMRETLNVIKTKEGNNYFIDSDNHYWRAFYFVENTICLQKVEKPEHFYESAKSFGNFMRQLEDFPADTLFETIEKFHDSENRFKNFKKALEEDKMGRAKDVQKEINFVLSRESDYSYLMNKLHNGEIPLRVTHNDTKLNNILIDEKSEQGICVIDLDTIMPGLCVNDYGDSIRFGASTGAEDEKDLDKVHFSLELFELYTKGYLEATGNALTEEERKCLRWGAKLMTLECGTRFLTDYLEGDTYFKVHREGHNLDRTRTQFRLVKEMEENWDKMQKIVDKY